MKPCQHLRLHKIANMGKGTYYCDDCREKFRLQEWDGKVHAIQADDPQGPEITE